MLLLARTGKGVIGQIKERALSQVLQTKPPDSHMLVARAGIPEMWFLDGGEFPAHHRQQVDAAQVEPQHSASS